jgi:hypothetical protein
VTAAVSQSPPPAITHSTRGPAISSRAISDSGCDSSTVTGVTAVFRRRGHGEALGGGPAPESPGELGHRANSWPALASTWLGNGSCRSPTVEVPVGSRNRSWVGTGTKGWGFARYDPATETYEPSGLPGGQPFGSAAEAYDTAAIVHRTEYAE